MKKQPIALQLADSLDYYRNYNLEVTHTGIDEQAADELRRLHATTKWQPIETAPQDNKRLLYLARFSDTGQLMELDYDGIWDFWQESWEMPDICGWCWMSAKGIEEPTHWAYQDEPLPHFEQKPSAWLCCVPGQDPCLLFDEPPDTQYPPGYKTPLFFKKD